MGRKISPNLPPMAAGQRYGRLVVIERAGSDRHGNSIWKFRCDCGNVKVTRAPDVRLGDTKSCGCQKSEVTIAANRQMATHGQTKSPEYKAWGAMFYRCYKPQCASFKDYGARGIVVCERWNDFENFYADMGPRPSSSHSIDRINNDGNYEPSNCRWATVVEQGRNRRTNHFVDYLGQRMTLKEAIAASGLKHSTVINRLKRGWPTDRALGDGKS